MIQASEFIWFNSVYANGNSTESIFEFQFTTSNRGPFYTTFFEPQEYKANPLLMEDVFGIDKDNPITVRDIRGNFASLIGATGEIYKFTGLGNGVVKALQDSDTHWFVYRYADVLLMQAEALVRLGGATNGQSAINIIKEIRLNRRALSITEQTVDASDTNGIIDYILAERAREFAFEGKRWYDILRVARANNYERKQLLIDLAVSTAQPSQQQSIIAKLKDSNSHYLPINSYELFTNKALIQNPFYK